MKNVVNETVNIRICGRKGFLCGVCNYCFRCALVHAARNGHFKVVSYLLSFDWVVNNPDQEVELCEAAQQSLVAAAAQGHVEVLCYSFSRNMSQLQKCEKTKYCL